jgi:hypothetical protein
MSVIWRGGMLLVAALAAFAPLPAAWVERGYSTSVYPWLQRLITRTSNTLPFALFDALIVAAIAALGVTVVVDVRRRGSRTAALRLIGRLVVWTAALYIAFVALWGLNYRREPLADKLQFDERQISSDAALRSAINAVDRLNALHDRAHQHGWPDLTAVDSALADGFHRVVRELGTRSAVVVGRPKITLLDLYLRRAGVEGMTDPYFLETLVQREILPFERPFIVAHEWSHLAGFADESEANFAGWLTCVRGSVADQYSGWLFLYSELVRAVPARDRSDVARRLAPGPRADLDAAAQRYRRQVNPRVSQIGWSVYDRYLKANRVEAGTASYDQVVRLVLGVRFDSDGIPLLR